MIIFSPKLTFFVHSTLIYTTTQRERVHDVGEDNSCFRDYLPIYLPFLFKKGEDN
jgi:hypothetical protein